jgi:hypothetical protein
VWAPFCQTVLGCVNLIWYEVEKEVKANGKLTDAASGVNAITNIPAQQPGDTWVQAVKNY